MTYKTMITSKGTTTIPVEIRRQLGIKPGMFVTFTKDPISGKISVSRSLNINEIRAINHKALMSAETINKKYSSGDGFTGHSKERIRP